MITQVQVKRLFNYDKDTGEFTRRVSVNKGNGMAGSVVGVPKDGYLGNLFDAAASRISAKNKEGFHPNHGRLSAKPSAL